MFTDMWLYFLPMQIPIFHKTAKINNIADIVYQAVLAKQREILWKQYTILVT